MVVAAPPRPARRTPRGRGGSLRILTAVPLCDGHDSAITTINLELARAGAEVIYLGYHQSASAIARAAIQEDVHAVGLSSYNGGHAVFFREVIAQLRARGAGNIPVFGGGGGTITRADERVMQRDGVDRIFFAGTPLAEIVATVRTKYARVLKPERALRGDAALARAITLAEYRTADTGNRKPDTGKAKPDSRQRASAAKRVSPDSKAGGFSFPVSGIRNPVSTLGVAGPGGAGKSTLIDELVSRFLRRRPAGRVAVLANDPSFPETGGAILGDRVSAIYSQDDRVFFRSLATRGHPSGLAAAAPAALELLRASGEFELIFVESVGIGQESDPFAVFGPGDRLVDHVLFVLSPHYGGRIQLQKIALLNRADLVALNKCDDPRAPTARTEITAHLAANARATALHATIAARHEDSGVDALYAAIAEMGGLTRGGEKPCHLEVTE